MAAKGHENSKNNSIRAQYQEIFSRIYGSDEIFHDFFSDLLKTEYVEQYIETLGIILSGSGRIMQGVRPVFAWLP